MNRLAEQPSSYLRSAAHQPVDWFPWGAEAFERARKEEKPVLLDIGAVWCHWCHVMDRESYEDPEVAERINRDFVAVKVDRDERPDVDARYQKAVQAMLGQGGWPLTAFLLPDGRPFYGGTYFPPRDTQGRPSFTRVLEAIADAYRTRREEILESAGNLGAHLASHGPRARARSDVTDETLARAVMRARESFDEAQGGWGRAPKFPHPAGHDFLLARAARGDVPSRAMAVATLDRMRAGGIYDQLAGGFHRYSVDRVWLVPHFEKMLYDNAGLLRNYARASRVVDRPELLETAREIARWMRDVLQQPGGGFGGSQDADVGLDDDGDYFTWTLHELNAAVPAHDLQRLAALHFGVTEKGHMHHDPAKNVLHVEADAEALAAALKRPEDEVRRDLARALDLMRAARAKRAAPFVDPVRYTAWNGMAIQALLELGGISGEREWDELALRALDVFLRDAYDPARGFARSPGREVYGLLDDNAQMLDALLEAHLATGDARHLQTAREVGDLLLTRFAHPTGGFQDRAPTLAPDAEAPTLDLPERPIQDAPTASPNGVALRALLRLSEATGEPRYRELAHAALETLAEEAADLGLFGGALLLALDDLVHPPPRVEVRGDAAWARPLVRRLAKAGAVFVPGGETLPDGAALVCLGDRCLAPATTPDGLAARLADARA